MLRILLLERNLQKGEVTIMRNNNRKFDEEEDRSKVKLYKTHRGWMSCLTRFFHLVSFSSKEEVRPQQFVDPDSIDDDKFGDTTDAYMKGLAALTTILGVSAVGAAAPTAVHAATNTTEDQGSQVVGSTSTSASESVSTSTS